MTKVFALLGGVKYWPYDAGNDNGNEYLCVIAKAGV